jgi:CBS-domain-containing membrane protein
VFLAVLGVVVDSARKSERYRPHACDTNCPPARRVKSVIILLALPRWGFLLMPTLLGASIIVVVALVFNNMDREVRYPKYWF